jgi:hypothetical protein
VCVDSDFSWGEGGKRKIKEIRRFIIGCKEGRYRSIELLQRLHWV